MFGYVNILKDELKIKEYNMFMSHYCGLCKRQGKLFGAPSRLALSYDFTVLAVFLCAMESSPPLSKRARCMLHPTKPRSVIHSSKALDYCAYMNIALTYFKIKDDIEDKSFSKYAALLPYFHYPMKKIKRKYGDICENIKQYLDKITQLEREKCNNIDEISSVFGHLMECIFEFGQSGNEAFKYMGYALGKWIYIADAIDDFSKDLKHGRYNPFLSVDDITKSLPSLWYNLSEVARAYELLEIKRNKGLTDNIIYNGLKSSTCRVLKNAGIDYLKSPV